MDYSLSEGIKNSNFGAIKKILHLYDINCQYHIHLRDRIEAGPYLSIAPHHEIIHGIGLMHIGGHVPTCFARYSPTFIPNAGRVDGEILESLWSVLNEVSPSTQNASHATRREMLDDHMNDNNWKKMLGAGELRSQFRNEVILTGIVVRISRKFRAATAGSEEASKDLSALIGRTSAEDREAWTGAEEKAQSQRREQIEAMDIYDSTMKPRMTPVLKIAMILTDGQLRGNLTFNLNWIQWSREQVNLMVQQHG